MKTSISAILYGTITYYLIHSFVFPIFVKISVPGMEKMYFSLI